MAKVSLTWKAPKRIGKNLLKRPRLKKQLLTHPISKTRRLWSCLGWMIRQHFLLCKRNSRRHTPSMRQASNMWRQITFTYIQSTKNQRVPGPRSLAHLKVDMAASRIVGEIWLGSSSNTCSKAWTRLLLCKLEPPTGSQRASSQSLLSVSSLETPTCFRTMVLMTMVGFTTQILA